MIGLWIQRLREKQQQQNDKKKGLSAQQPQRIGNSNVSSAEE